MSTITSIRVLSAIALSCSALAAEPDREERYALKAPNEVSFAEIRGYEDWPLVAPAQIEKGGGEMDSLKGIVANPVMIDAYKAGIPGNGKPFPDGSKIVKIEWTRVRNPESPYPAYVPADLRRVAFIMKDSKRFPGTNGWGYAQFLYDPKTGTFAPEHSDPAFAKPLCHTCHLAVTAKDYIFTRYPPR